MSRLLCVLLLSTLTAAACGKHEAAKENNAPAAAADPAPAGEGHAPAGVVPGSYEDWCGGHGVPESLCTRCNSALIPAFKAANDWCAEHNLPESQCKICNPDLKIERPAKPSAQPSAKPQAL